MNPLEKQSLILASKSVTRQKMLSAAGLDFFIEGASVDEDAIKDSLVAEAVFPRDIADFLAEAKARSVAMMYPDALVIGSDQILELDGEIFSKANTLDEAKIKLSNLAGKKHRLWSAAVIMHGDKAIWRHVGRASLTMRSLNAEQIDAYLGQIGDAAFSSVGAYQIEGLGSQLFDAVEGDYNTVLGMPLLPLLVQLRRLGHDALPIS